MSTATTERRAADGTFKNYAGPGRPSAKLKELHARYKGESLAATAKLLTDDIPRLESELQAIDDELADAEHKFPEQIAPTVKHREEIGVTLSRARVALHYVADPIAFTGMAPYPGDVALDAYCEVRRELDAAQAALANTAEPRCTKAEALGDADLWQALHDYETIRDKVDELLGAEAAARQTAEACGIQVEPLEDGPSMASDPFNAPRITRREVVAGL